MLGQEIALQFVERLQGETGRWEVGGERRHVWMTDTAQDTTLDITQDATLVTT